MTEPAFTLSTHIDCYMEGAHIKFKSFHNVRKIFDLYDTYTVATEQQVEQFCASPLLFIEDIVSFRVNADQQIRKLIHSISVSGVLANNTAGGIAAAAAAVGIAVVLDNDRIVFPNDKNAAKLMLRFLDESVYVSQLSADRYITNSKRRI